MRVGEGVVNVHTSLFPYFIWQSDAELFNLFVYKKYQEESIQDVLSRDPVLQIEGFPKQVFQYPTDTSPLEFADESGKMVGKNVGPIRLLEPGETYYWYVEANIPTVTSETILNSDVYQFKVAQLEQSEATANLILSYLQQILQDRYENYMMRLQGFSPNGNILINDTPVKIEALIGMINKISRDEVKIQNISIE